jgi:hypothetical protein
MIDEQQVRFGFFKEFERPTILCWGSVGALRTFAHFLRTLPYNKRQRIMLHELSWVKAIGSTQISLEIMSKNCGMLRSKTYPDSEFIWLISETQAKHFAELVEAVSASTIPCHQYLECDGGDEVVVIVSKGEYDHFDGAFY